MRNSTAMFIVGVCSCLVFSASVTKAQKSTQACTLAIVSPEQGSQVGAMGTVSGTAKIPGDGHVWALVHVKGLAGWWPQGGGEAELVNGEWSVRAFYGGNQDVGSPFEIAAVVVAASVNQDLNMYVQKATTDGNWPPIKFPDVLQGCPIARVTVTKAKH